MPKRVFIAHPVSGDIRGNLKRVLAILKEVHTKDTIPYFPSIVALQYLDDNNAAERELGMLANEEYFTRGFIDE
jgi:hypothetical protein